MTFRITHINEALVKRRCTVTGAASRQLAEAWVRQLYGEARVVASICLRGQP